MPRLIRSGLLLSLFRCLLRPLVGVRLFAVAALTWKAAFRSRLFLGLSALLLATVVALPLLIKHDGTAQGFTQLLITYTLSAITAVLGLTTLWLACGSLAKDIEECQMQMVAVKPIPRWQIWLGKWLGIMMLNAVLLFQSGLCVYALLMFKARGLSAEQRQVLSREVLVARGSLKEPLPNIQGEVQRNLESRLQNRDLRGLDVGFMRRQAEEQVRAQYQIVPPGHKRVWSIPIGPLRFFLKDQTNLVARLRFYAGQTNAAAMYWSDLRIGPPDTARERAMIVKLPADAFQEIELPPNMWDDEGVLTIAFINLAENGAAVLFPLEDGLEVLYREGGFGLNFCRGLAIVLCWLALLAALGLASASLMSFPVAAFASIAVLVIAMSGGVLASAVENETIMSYSDESGGKGSSPLDVVLIPMFRVMLQVINVVQGFSPVDSLSAGRSITWGQLGLAWLQIGLLLGGVLAVAGIAIFTRRELATAQGTS